MLLTDLELADLKTWHQTSPFFSLSPETMNSQPTSWPSRPSAAAVSSPRSAHTRRFRWRRDSWVRKEDKVEEEEEEEAGTRYRKPRKIKGRQGGAFWIAKNI